MHDSELKCLLASIHETSKQQLNATLEMMCGLAAAVDTLQDTLPGFARVYREKYQTLQCGELIKARNHAAFEELIRRLKQVGS